MIITDNLMTIAHDPSQPREIRKQIFDDRDIELAAMKIRYAYGRTAKDVIDSMISQGYKHFAKNGKRWGYLWLDGYPANQLILHSKIECEYAKMVIRRKGP